MSFIMIASVGVAIIFIALVIIFLIPSGKKESKKKERPPEQLPKEKDWQSTAHKLEGHINALRTQLAELDKKRSGTEKELLVTKAKNKELQEKLTMEDGWIKKEQEEIDKKSKELMHLKDELKKKESTLEDEHSQRLRLERELKELRQNFDTLEHQRKKQDIEIEKVKASLEIANKDLIEYKRENIQLKKKQEDVSFVAKAEYDKVERLLKERDKELERIKREA